MSLYSKKLKTPAAAEYVGLSVHTLNGLRYRGGGPAYFKLGSAVIYSIDQLDKWLLSRQRKCARDIKDITESVNDA